MAWVLLDDNFPLHPKAVQAGPVAAYLYVCALCYCRRYHTEGFIPEAALTALGLSVRPKKIAQALVDARLWDVADGGFRIHDYDSFYEDVTEKALKAARRSNGRKGGIERSRLNRALGKPVGGGTGTDQDLLEKGESNAFELFWTSYPRKDGKQAAREAWDKLNPDDATRAAIEADVQQRARSPQWAKDDGQYIPHAKTYLRQRRWEDGFQQPIAQQHAFESWQCPHVDECSHRAMCRVKVEVGTHKYPLKPKAEAS